MNKFVIKGRLLGLNEYTSLNRTNRYKGAKSKAEQEKIIRLYVRMAKLRKLLNPIKIAINWYEPNAKRDIDNITFATKFILDSLVHEKVIVNDSQRYVKEITHKVYVDKNDPRIEVELGEIYE